ncbi:MAG TPA: glycosyltransferase family 9 protein [Chloroflexia bacterium]|nr:glycosyltransferase family 9 protein [Chloroflexia bacterium]
MRILIMALLPIGDTLFATPAIHALRKRYPGAHITALTYPTNKGILRSNPDIDDFLAWPTREAWPGMRNVLKLFWRLRRARFDLSVEFSNYNLWIARLAGIGERTEMNLPRFWWGLPGAGHEWRKHHAVEHYSDIVRRIGIPVEELRLRLYPDAEEEARAQGWLDRHRIEEGELLIAMHPGGEGLWGRKRWPVERFAEVADGLCGKLGARIVIMGGKDEAHLAAELAARTHANIINAVGQTTLGETAALTRRCTLFIGNDSSPLHMAVAMGTRVVAIHGLTDPRSYHPWVPGGKEGVDYAIVRSPLPCAHRFPLVGGITIPAWFTILRCPALEAIKPQQVLDAALSLLT